MSAAVFPFPLARRRDMIARQARYAAELSADAGERHIAHQVKLQADAMRRKGVSEDLIAREIACMDRAIRALLERAMSGGVR
ncbi:DUF6074 family protein [Bradyrhizobium sp. MOS002]|uniref:DUF6074 family protein n=1 Tax=Bradyrhizobium sp. MOS002 TaxID=2133947 RepID=UPI000D119FC2|nr:DUF6074 family protein [Bradyrhizobium sp. MOS002]PSO29838.1 hypothetical protein C7G41_24145 [Bradyrhizobium sp. MOS002]